MPPARRMAGRFEELPDPGSAGSLDDLAERLRMLKVWAGDPSYERITARVNAAVRAGRPAAELVGKTTVVNCFRAGRRRVDPDLIVAVVAALHPDIGYTTQWRQALQRISGQATAAGQVRVQDTLPPPRAGFTGRTTELERLRAALHTGGPVVISAIAGMAGVGKTELAVHAAHRLLEQHTIDRVLFVNLRGFHPDPAQPPADPAAVLDGFLRLLGVPGQHIPHDLSARTRLYQQRLTGTRTLVLLDNATDTAQVQPLLPGRSGCPVLITSRRDLTALDAATHLTVDVFTPPEAAAFLAEANPGIPAGPDPEAVTRIAARCGHLPLALALTAAHMRTRRGWTLTDHADRLDHHHDQLRLDSGIQLALDLSYRQLPADRQRLLRLLALHPGQDFDVHAAAALTGADPATTALRLDDLRRDHLLQPAASGRYTLHDLIRGYAAAQSGDEDPPPQRRAALTRLFDYYLATAAAAMDTLHPAETHRRPRIPPFPTAPVLTDPDAARGWLGAEGPTLVTVAAHTASHGWPAHTTRLSATLHRYLDGGHITEGLAIHGHALRAAGDAGDSTARARALTSLGGVHSRTGRYEAAIEHLEQALHLFRQTDDPAGQAHALHNLGVVLGRQGRYHAAADAVAQALALYRRIGDQSGEADARDNLGVVEDRLGHHREVVEHFGQAVALCRKLGNRFGEARALNGLGVGQIRLGEYGPAADHLQQGLALCRQIGYRAIEGRTLDSLGILHLRRDRPARAAAYFRQALAVFRETGERDGQTFALLGLGQAAQADARAADAVTHHSAALAVATDIGDRWQQARAHAGLGHAHRALGDTERARDHYQQARALYTDLDMPDADQMRAQLAAIPAERVPAGDDGPGRGGR